MIKKILVGSILLFVIALGSAYFVRNLMVDWAIEEEGSYSLGVETHLNSANLTLSAGSLELNNYEVDNPAGFDKGEIISIKYGILAVNSGSVFADTVVIDSLVLQGVKVTLEHLNGKSNYSVLLDHIATVDYGSTDSKTTLHFKKISISDSKVAASVTLPGNKHIEETFELDKITLNDVGGKNGTTIAKATATIIREIIKEALAEGGKKLPSNVGQYFKDFGQGGLERVTSSVKEKVKDIGSSLLGEDKKKK